MARSYGYMFDEKCDFHQQLEASGVSLTQIESLHIERVSDSELRPELESLLETMNDGDTLIFPSFEHVGCTMADVILTVDSLAMMNINVKLLDSNDSKFLDRMGGEKAFAENLKTLLDLQSRVLKTKQSLGIKKAKESDASLPDWQRDKKKYKGRIGAPTSTKLKATALRLNGKTPSEIAKLMGLSRGSVYNYTKSVEQTHPYAVAAYQYLTSIPNYQLKPFFTYHNVCLFLLDIYLYLMEKPQFEIRKLTEMYVNSGLETTCNTAFLDMVKNGKLNETLNLKSSNCRHFEDSNLALERLSDAVVRLELDTMFMVYDHTNGDMSELISGDIEKLDLIAIRINHLTNRDYSYTQTCLLKLLSKIGNSEPSEREIQKTWEALQSFIPGGDQRICIGTTIAHYTD